jgi:hypothetical protein
MLDAKIITDATREKKISERILVGLRTLATCNNWKKVNPLGLIDHKTALVNYQGMLVELDKRAYFMRKETVEALKKELKWKVTQVIRVE